MVESFLEIPYRETLNQDGQIEPEFEGYHFFEIATNNNYDIDRLDYEVGSVQWVHELSLSFYGLDQEYIGKVFEEPSRYQFGSYVFEREGFAESGSREVLQYEKTRIVWRTEIYNLSRNQAARPKSIQYSAKPLLTIEPVQTISLESNGFVRPVPLTGVFRNEVAGFGLNGGISLSSGAIGSWSTSNQSFVVIGPTAGGPEPGPLETLIDKEELLFQLKDSEIALGERKSRYDAIDLGTLIAEKERTKIIFTLYQGIGADYTYKIYQCGIYRDSPQLPIYPNPSPGGGGGDGN
jgi:hypothetical protein